MVTFGHLRVGNGYFRVNVENHRISTGHLFFTIYAEAQLVLFKKSFLLTAFFQRTYCSAKAFFLSAKMCAINSVFDCKGSKLTQICLENLNLLFDVNEVKGQFASYEESTDSKS